MNAWLIAIILFMPPFAVAVAVAMRSDCDNRLVATQFASGLAVLSLGLMTFAFDQPSFMDLAFALVLLSVPGTYLVTLFMERWL